MAALPPRTSLLDEQLLQWVDAGLISSDQADRIRGFEASATGGAESNTEADELAARAGPLPRPSSIELLAYLGVAVALTGVLTLVYTSHVALTGVGAVTSTLGAAALIAAYAFARIGGAQALRAAGACLGLAAAGLGFGAGELASAAALFTKTITTPGICGPDVYCPPYMSTSQWGNVLLGAGVALAVAAGLIRYTPGPVPALVSVGAAYTAAAAVSGLAGFDVRGPSATGIGFILVIASAGVVAFGETLRRRQPAVHAFYGFVGIVGATIPLYLLGSGDDGMSVHLDIVGGIIASVALVTGIAIRRAGVAYGAVVGLAGLILDIGLRNFHTSTSIGVFLTAFGGAVIGMLLAVSALVRTRGK